jgi:hypothetical protein
MARGKPRVIVTVSCLGNMGRFGNQLFQYAYARAYAESIGAELHTPDWIGRQLFAGVDEPIMEDKGDEDLVGYFQQPEHLKLLSRRKLRQWFTFKNPVDVPEYDLIFHKRRGDYLNTLDFWGIVTDESYVKAAEKHDLDPSQALVLDDDRQPEYLINDFFLMMKCKNLFRSNSTFSWWAATLGDARVFSPMVRHRVGWIDVAFVEGNDEMLCKDTESMKIRG